MRAAMLLSPSWFDLDPPGPTPAGGSPHVLTNLPPGDLPAAPAAGPSPAPPALVLCEPVYLRIMAHLADTPPEDGGFLLGPRGCPHLVTHYLPDITGLKTPVSFKPDAARANGWLRRLNDVFAEADAGGLDFKGVVHSHPDGIPSPSDGDLAFAAATLGRAANAGAGVLFLPVVCEGRFHPYAVARDLAVRPVPLVLV